MPSKKQRARERRAAREERTKVTPIDPSNMPLETRIYVAVDPLIPELNDFVVCTTHGNMMGAIELARQVVRGDGDESTVASVRDNLTRHSREILIEWATSDNPPDEWVEWCSDVILATAYKHVCDGELIALRRPKRELVDQLAEKNLMPTYAPL